MARSFNGSTDQIDCGSGVPSNANAITISAWVNMSSLSPSYSAVVSRFLLGNPDFYSFLVKSTGKIAYYISGGGGFTVSLDPGIGTISTGAWHNIILVYDSTNGLKTFLDGVSDGTVATGGWAHAYGASHLSIGTDLNTAGRSLGGSIADVAIWDATLTASEVAAIVAGVRPYRIQRSKLLGYWPLEGTASPEPDVINGNDGTLTGTSQVANPTYGSADIVGGAKFGARSFNGSTDLITIGTGVTASSGAFTASVWAKLSASPVARGVVFTRDDSGGGQAAFYMIIRNTGKIDFEVGSGGGFAKIDPGTATISTGVWTHLLLTCNNSTTTLNAYVNGVLDGTNPAASMGALSGASLIGAYSGGLNFAGDIADAAQWNVILTAGEIAALASGVRPHNIRPLSLAGYWPVDGISSPEPDLSGFGNNGTLTGTTNASGPPMTLFTPRRIEFYEAPSVTPPTLFAQACL